jgi:hypothetical protein
MSEIRGDLRDTVDDITEHLVTCGEKYAFSCSRVAMHQIELLEFIQDQPRDVRRYLLAILHGVVGLAEK